MKIFQAVTADRQVLMEVRDDNDKALAHVTFDPPTARNVAGILSKLADIAEAECQSQRPVKPTRS